MSEVNDHRRGFLKAAGFAGLSGLLTAGVSYGSRFFKNGLSVTGEKAEDVAVANAETKKSADWIVGEWWGPDGVGEALESILDGGIRSPDNLETNGGWMFSGNENYPERVELLRNSLKPEPLILHSYDELEGRKERGIRCANDLPDMTLSVVRNRWAVSPEVIFISNQQSDIFFDNSANYAPTREEINMAIVEKVGHEIDLGDGHKFVLDKLPLTSVQESMSDAELMEVPIGFPIDYCIEVFTPCGEPVTVDLGGAFRTTATLLGGIYDDQVTDGLILTGLGDRLVALTWGVNQDVSEGLVTRSARVENQKIKVSDSNDGDPSGKTEGEYVAVMRKRVNDMQELKFVFLVRRKHNYSSVSFLVNLCDI